VECRTPGNLHRNPAGSQWKVASVRTLALLDIPTLGTFPHVTPTENGYNERTMFPDGCTAEIDQETALLLPFPV
jgi:hypothetical protein